MMNLRCQTLTMGILGTIGLAAVLGLLFAQGVAADADQQCLSVDLGAGQAVRTDHGFFLPLRLVSGLGEEPVFSFEGRLQWEAELLVVDSGEEGPGRLLMDNWVLQVDYSEPGTLSFVAYSVDSKLVQTAVDANDGVLAEFSFRALSGTTEVRLGEFMFNEGSPCSATATTTVTPVQDSSWGSIKSKYE